MNEQVVCPRNLKWLAAMLNVLPIGLRGRLEPFATCVKEQERLTPKERVAAVARK